jgi:NADP-dependent 3-hydroxy acid dehydrogenase YdfG
MSRTVLITGAAGHLGKAVADHFAGQGARLALLDRQQAVLAATYPETGDRLLLATDLLDGAQTDAAIAAVVERLGRIDLLCHLVGGFRMGQPVHAASDADWDFLFDINTRTLRNVARAAVPRTIAAGGARSSP